MATVKLKLVDGITLSGELQMDVELRAPTAGDILDANAESEKAVPTADGYQLLVSPSQIGAQVLRRQIVAIGTHSGPLTLNQLKALSRRDYAALQEQASHLDAALGSAVEQRGRTPAPGGRTARG